jgi:hypothetical protein
VRIAPRLFLFGPFGSSARSLSSTVLHTENNVPQKKMNTDDVLEALFAINKYAREYAGEATDAYESGWKGQARKNSIRKEALYRYKTHILQDLHQREVFDRVEQHEIDGEDYYCFYRDRGDWSFHAPVDQWEESGLDVENPSPSATQELTDFDPVSPSEVEDLLGERDALRRLSKDFPSVNEFLSQPFLHHEYRSEFAGWNSLPGAIEEGDSVSEEEFLSDHRGEFMFEVGDRFDTVEQGEVRIVDRYGMWLESRFYGGDIRPRAAYDVEFTASGEGQNGVREETIRDEWRVEIQSTRDPTADISGNLAEIYSDSLAEAPDLSTGDRILLSPYDDSDGPVEYTVGSITVSGIPIMVELVPTDDDTRREVLSVEEIKDDIVNIHRC